MELRLPAEAVSDRISSVSRVEEGRRETVAVLEGAGCIRHIFLVLSHPQHNPLLSRKAVIRIYFDGETVPFVEAPAGDFFGVMHGESYYDINNRYLSVKAWNGYNCYFPMPFARGARIEIEAGSGGTAVYLLVDWHRYPGGEMPEALRFCSRWRREMPARSYSKGFLLLDAPGPGRLLGFVYGVRLIDDTDRWSHGGADNIYIDGEGDYPAYLRGIGGEDCFGSGYGGNLHPPDSHLYEGLPFYTHDDQGLSRPAPRLVGYRFYEQDAIHYRESIQFRFGCMANDICSTVYWYQQGPVRPFYALPGFDGLMPGSELPAGSCDLPLPDRGAWAVAGPVETTAPAGSPPAGLVWTSAPSAHGFVDFNHYFRPVGRGVGTHHTGVAALARCVLQAPRETLASLRLSWDDDLYLSVNGAAPTHLGKNGAFRSRSVDVPLVKGPNSLLLRLSNERGSNHGGWAFAFSCRTAEGEVLLPEAAGRADAS